MISSIPSTVKEELSQSHGSALPTVVFQSVANTTTSQIEAELGDFHVQK